MTIGRVVRTPVRFIDWAGYNACQPVPARVVLNSEAVTESGEAAPVNVPRRAPQREQRRFPQARCQSRPDATPRPREDRHLGLGAKTLAAESSSPPSAPGPAVPAGLARGRPQCAK